MTPGFNRPTRAIISLPAIIHNYQTIKNTLAPEQEVIAVIKADGYGHGAVKLAETLQPVADSFAVAISDEAVELRDAGIEKPVFLLGLSEPHHAWFHASRQIGVTFDSLFWLETAYSWRNAFKGQRIKLHFKIDSGMGRIGVRNCIAAQEIINYINFHQDLFELVSIYTHFATADGLSDAEQAQVQKQLMLFNEITDALDYSVLEYKPKLHISNTALGLWYPQETKDAVRLGIGLYGVNPSNGSQPMPLDLKPALSLETAIVHVKQMAADETISYGGNYTTQAGEWIATLPIGYADGWTRNLIGLPALVEGQRCPTVGRICMDQCMIRLPHEMPIGTKVTLLGENGGERITAEMVGEYAGTIGYETLCLISNRVPRVYLES